MCEDEANQQIPYLRSCKKEISSPVTGKITGNIPEWLRGHLIRIGSGLLEVGPHRYNHLFDGLALMHKFSFQNGQVTYQNKFLRSDTYRKNIAANKIVVAEFGTPVADPCKTVFQRLMSFFSLTDFTDNDLVNIVKYTDDYFACSETNYIWKIDPETLESQKKVDLRQYVPVMTGTAHPHEAKDGTVYNIGNYFGWTAQYVLIKFPPKVDNQSSVFDRGSVICKIPASKSFSPSYFHSFGITENYFIFVEQPLNLSLWKVLSTPFNSNSFVDCMEWHPEDQTRFHVIRREDGKLLETRYVSKAFMVFHHINAYEENDHLIVDLVCYQNSDIIKNFYIEAIKKSSKNMETSNFLSAEPRRYILPLKLHKNKDENLITLQKSKAKSFLQKDGSVICEPELLCEQGCSVELPRINYEKFNGRQYRYFYCISQMGKQSFTYISSLAKVDTENRTSLHWKEENVIPSEPVFVANPSLKCDKEDSGLLLASLLYKDDDKKVSLLVLNAENMKELGRATFQVESSIPGDFHGIFIHQRN